MHTSDFELASELYRTGVIQLGSFKLKTGLSSPIYMDLRRIVSYPTLLRDITTRMWKQINDRPFDLVCGVPYTALPIATCMSLDHDVPMVMRRKEKKDYDTKQKIEGVYREGQTCLIVEDVATTGGSILETSADVLETGLIIRDVVVFIDREQGAKEALQKSNLRLHPVYTMSQVLNNLLEAAILSPTEAEMIQQVLAEQTS